MDRVKLLRCFQLWYALSYNVVEPRTLVNRRTRKGRGRFLRHPDGAHLHKDMGLQVLEESGCARPKRSLKDAPTLLLDRVGQSDIFIISMPGHGEVRGQGSSCPPSMVSHETTTIGCDSARRAEPCSVIAWVGAAHPESPRANATDRIRKTIAHTYHLGVSVTNSSQRSPCVDQSLDAARLGAAGQTAGAPARWVARLKAYFKDGGP
jgi:hypothetical protein